MDKKTVYIETSIVSYLTARPTNDLLAAAWQKATIDWWETQRTRFDLYTSDVAIEEAERGDPDAARRRLEALSAFFYWRSRSRLSRSPKRISEMEPCRPRPRMMPFTWPYPPCMVLTIC